MTQHQENRIALLILAARHMADCDGTPELREQIKSEVHEWPRDLIIETLLDAGVLVLELPNTLALASIIANKKLDK
mgnify:CR=1 FL=1